MAGMKKNMQGMMGKSPAQKKANGGAGKSQPSAGKSNGNLPKSSKRPMPPPYKPLKRGR